MSDFVSKIEVQLRFVSKLEAIYQVKPNKNIKKLSTSTSIDIQSNFPMSFSFQFVIITHKIPPSFHGGQWFLANLKLAHLV